MIRKAIKASPALTNRNIHIAAHGSYRSNTNVRQNSDVDIYVCCRDVLFTDFSHAQNFSESDVGFASAAYTYPIFKSEVHDALVAHFGSGGVVSGNKAFDIQPNSYRVEADVLPCIEYRLYTTRNQYGGFNYVSGVKAFSSKNEEIINWPEQNYENGATKNIATSHVYKKVARIIKRLRYEMADAGNAAASAIPSYLVECMVYNVPNGAFTHPTYTADVRHVLAHLYNALDPSGDCTKWVEINGMHYLFHPEQAWTREKAFNFVREAWNYIGFE